MNLLLFFTIVIVVIGAVGLPFIILSGVAAWRASKSRIVDPQNDRFIPL